MDKQAVPPVHKPTSSWRQRFAWMGIGLLMATAAFGGLALASNSFAQDGDSITTRPLTALRSLSTQTGMHDAMPIFNELVPKSAVADALATAVADGILSDEQAQKIQADIAAAMPVFDGIIADHDIVITADGSLPNVPGLLGPLHHGVMTEVITDAQFRQIVALLSDLAGDDIEATFTDEGNNTTFELQINGNPEALQEQLLAAIDQAAAEGHITAEQAATLRDTVNNHENKAFPLFLESGAMPSGFETIEIFEGPDGFTTGTIVIDGVAGDMMGTHAINLNGEAFASDISFAEGGDPLVHILTRRLGHAVSEGKLTQAEADALQETLTNAFD